MTIPTDNESASRYFRNLGVSNPASRVDKVGSNPTCRNLPPFTLETLAGCAGSGASKSKDTDAAPLTVSENLTTPASSFDVYPKSPLIAGIAIGSAIATMAVIAWLVLGGLR